MESPVQDTDKRSEGRANVFLSASLDGGRGQVAVRVRNLSSRGALVEALSFPPIGTRVRLLRGELATWGELAWVGAGQAGINFAGEINVDLWVKRPGAGGQQRVDGVIAALRGSGKIPTELEDPQNSPSLAAISAELDEICDRLANTPNLSIALAENFLRLDSVAQNLRRMATGRSF